MCRGQETRRGPWGRKRGKDSNMSQESGRVNEYWSQESLSEDGGGQRDGERRCAGEGHPRLRMYKKGCG